MDDLDREETCSKCGIPSIPEVRRDGDAYREDTRFWTICGLCGAMDSFDEG